MASLKTLLKRRDDLSDALFDLAEQNFDEMQADMAARDDSGPSKESRARSKKIDKMRIGIKKLEAQIEKLRNKEKDRKKPTESKKEKLKGLSLRGRGGGGAMTDLTRRTGKSLLQSEFRKKL